MVSELASRNPHPASAGITGVILAGGLGRRMGGVDKGLQWLRGKPMAAWVIERLAPQVDEILINANQNIEAYARFGYRVIPDEIAGFAGPLAGLHRGLTEAAHGLVATAALRFAVSCPVTWSRDCTAPLSARMRNSLSPGPAINLTPCSACAANRCCPDSPIFSPVVAARSMPGMRG